MATPTFNKYKSTTIYGNLSVRDLTNSSGSSVIEVASIDLSGNFLSRGDSTFTKKVICNASVGDINANNILTTKEYVDNAVSTGGQVSLTGTNNFTGFNTYNTNLPTSNLGAGAISGSEQFLTKGMMDNIYGRLGSVNHWTNENSFNSYLPTSTITPTSASQLTTKTFVDTAISNLSFVYQTIANMSNYLTTATASATYSTLTNQVKTNTANEFTSTNTFNTNLPTSTLTPSSSTQLTTKAYVDSISGSSLLSSNNTFTGLNTFNNDVDINAKLLRITNANPQDGEFRIVDTNDVVQISISPIGFNQIDPTGENSFSGQTYIYNDVFVSNASININTGDIEITDGTINQISGSSFLKNLTVDNIAYTSSVILTSTSQDYSNSKTPNYIFHSRTATTASSITLSTDGYIIDGQYLYIRRINTGAYTLTITAGSGTNFLITSSTTTSIQVFSSDFVGIQFIYDKPNTRWIKLTV
jgi:hypothetical protein